MKEFINYFDPDSDAVKGSFAYIRKRTTNLKKFFQISTNNNFSFVYENIIGVGSVKYHSRVVNGNANITIEMKRHLMQVSHFVVGEPFEWCFSREFNLTGKDEFNNEIDLGTYSNLEHDFCSSSETSSDIICEHNNSVIFKVAKETKKLLKSITYTVLRGSCKSYDHIAIRGIDLFGNLYEVKKVLTCRCRRTLFSFNILLMIVLFST